MKYEIASARKRLAAFMIDNILNLVVFIFQFHIAVIPENLRDGYFGINMALVATKMSYWAVGTSFGKSYFQLTVVDQNTMKPLDFKKMFLRQTIGMLVSFSVLNMGFIWIFIDRDRQGWHDKIFNDVVINQKKPIRDRIEDEFIHGY